MSVNHLKKLMFTKQINIKDIKAQALLAVIHNYLHQYFEAIKNNDFKVILEDDKSLEEQKILEKEFYKIYKYLDKNIYTYFQLEQIIKESKKDKKSYEVVQTLEPIIFYYNYIINQVTSRLLNFYNSKDKVKWKPELLAFYFILDYKESFPSIFKKHEYLQNFDFEKISNIVINENKKLKQKFNIQGYDKNSVLVPTKMQNIANQTILSLIKKKYKIKRN